MYSKVICFELGKRKSNTLKEMYDKIIPKNNNKVKDRIVFEHAIDADSFYHSLHIRIQISNKVSFLNSLSLRGAFKSMRLIVEQSF